MLFEPVPSKPPATPFGHKLTAALWERTKEGWNTWSRTQRAWGWTHGDWITPGDNMSVHGNHLTIWDLGTAGWGPLGWDVASIWLNARFASSGPTVAQTAINSYVTHRGKVDVRKAQTILEPVVAAASALACAQRARYRPELVDEASKRIHSALHDTSLDYMDSTKHPTRWTPLSVITTPT